MAYSEFTGAGTTPGTAMNGTTFANAGNATYQTGASASLILSGTSSGVFSTVGYTLTKADTFVAYINCVHAAAVAQVVAMEYVTPTLPTAAQTIIGNRSASAAAGYTNMGTDGSLLCQNASGGLIASTTTPAIAAGDVIVIDKVVVSGTTTANGRVIFQVTNKTNATWNTTGVFYYDSGYTLNCGTVNLTTMRLGDPTTGGAFGPINYRNLRWSELASVDPSTTPSVAKANFITHLGANALPVGSAGGDKIGFVGTAVAVSVSDSDADGTITSRALTLVETLPAGLTAPTLTGGTTATPTLTAVAGSVGGRFRYKYNATDNLGGVSPDSFMYFYVPSTTAKPIEVTGTTEYTLIGGGSVAVNLATADAATTGVTYPVGQTVAKTLKVRLAPLSPMTTISIPVNMKLSAAGTGTLVVKLYEGATVRYTWTTTYTNSTLGIMTLVQAGGTAGTNPLAGTGNLIPISNLGWCALDLEFTWGA